MLKRWSLPSMAPVVVTIAVGLVIGIGVTYTALRPHDEPSVSAFDGAPSVQTIDRPAGLTSRSAPTAEEILANATITAASVATPAAEPANARAALTEFLTAEAADRSETSFALLTPDVQRRYGSLAAWRQSRSDRVVPQRFTILGESAVNATQSVVTIRAERSPSITPFRGLVPAESTERWALEQNEASQWRVRSASATTTEPQLPADADARAVAQQWVDRAAACETAATRALQVAPDLVGATDLSGLACEAGGLWSTTSEAVPVADLPDVTAFVAAFGPSVGRWARGVVVANGDQQMTVILGPLGGEWRVVGLTLG